MYEFTLLDAFFASVAVVIVVLMAFSFGYTCKMERLTKVLASETQYVDTLSERLAYAISDACEARIQHGFAMVEQERALVKTHREAMKKYKARCNTKLARQIDLIEKATTKTVTVSGLTGDYDLSPLLSK